MLVTQETTNVSATAYLTPSAKEARWAEIIPSDLLKTPLVTYGLNDFDRHALKEAMSLSNRHDIGTGWIRWHRPQDRPQQNSENALAMSVLAQQIAHGRTELIAPYLRERAISLNTLPEEQQIQIYKWARDKISATPGPEFISIRNLSIQQINKIKSDWLPTFETTLDHINFFSTFAGAQTFFRLMYAPEMNRFKPSSERSNIFSPLGSHPISQLARRFGIAIYQRSLLEVFITDVFSAEKIDLGPKLKTALIKSLSKDPMALAGSPKFFAVKEAWHRIHRSSFSFSASEIDSLLSTAYATETTSFLNTELKKKSAAAKTDSPLSENQFSLSDHRRELMGDSTSLLRLISAALPGSESLIPRWSRQVAFLEGRGQEVKRELLETYFENNATISRGEIDSLIAKNLQSLSAQKAYGQRTNSPRSSTSAFFKRLLRLLPRGKQSSDAENKFPQTITINIFDGSKVFQSTKTFSDWEKQMSAAGRGEHINYELDKVRKGNLGKYRNLLQGLWELKRGKDRIYFTKDGLQSITILLGGDKNSQESDIVLARKYLSQVRAAANATGVKDVGSQLAPFLTSAPQKSF